MFENIHDRSIEQVAIQIPNLDLMSQNLYFVKNNFSNRIESNLCCTREIR